MSFPERSRSSIRPRQPASLCVGCLEKQATELTSIIWPPPPPILAKRAFDSGQSCPVRSVSLFDPARLAPRLCRIERRRQTVGVCVDRNTIALWNCRVDISRKQLPGKCPPRNRSPLFLRLLLEPRVLRQNYPLKFVATPKTIDDNNNFKRPGKCYHIKSRQKYR